MADETRDKDSIIIKKYANRRLYNTATSSYVTLDHLAQMVREGTDFEVIDAKTGNDITHQVLTHIIVDEESKGENMLPLNFLRQLIALYGDSLQAMVPGYLEQTMKAFSGNQVHIRETMEKAFGSVTAGANPMAAFEDMTRQNMETFETAMKAFNPLMTPLSGVTPGTGTAKSAKDKNEIESLRAQVDQLRKQLDEVSKKD